MWTKPVFFDFASQAPLSCASLACNVWYVGWRTWCTVSTRSCTIIWRTRAFSTFSSAFAGALHTFFLSPHRFYDLISFNRMNCLLLRELPLRAIIRVWDTYLSEERGGFENFHVYVCAVILKTYKDRLMVMDFQAILMFLQDMPTQEWGESDVECILSQAYILSTLFDDSPSHLN